MDQLKRLRLEKGLSQAKLAALADVDPSTVNQIERGARDASPATLRKLADALEVSIAELLEDADPKAPAPPSPQPTLNGALEELRRTVEHNEAAGALDEFRELMEKKLAAGELDRATIEETGAVARAFWPSLLLALEAETRELTAMHRGEPEVAESLSALRPAAERFLSLADEINGVYREMLRKAAKAREAPASNVVYAFPQREAS
jgi:transcriptional regulator with XRE-family HTH domain